MISWIQKYFQSHFKVIFAVLLAVIIISFVFTIGAAPGIGNADRRMVDRHFFGYNLSLQQDQQKLMGDAGLSANLRVGAFAQLENEQIQNYAFQRAATLHLADQWHIPPATDAEIRKQIETLRMFSGQDGKFDAKAYQSFRDNLKANSRGLSEHDVKRVISDDIRADKVQALLAGPGYVLPADVKSQLERSDTTWTLATAAADYNAFKPEIKPTDLELTQFFEQAGGRYDIPPRVALSYAEFPAAVFLANIMVTEAEVRAFYDANPSRFPKPTPPATTPGTPNVAPAADPASDFAAVRSDVEAALKLERAQRFAAKAASDFSLALYESKARTSEAILSFVTSRKLALQKLPPFARNSPPAELGGSMEVTNEAFRLSADRPVSDALSTSKGAVILFWNESQPSHRPQFVQVRESVQNDYIESERRKRFVELGKTIKAQIEARLKAGDTFEQAATSAGTQANLKVETKNIPAFSPRSPAPDMDREIFGTLERLEKGKVSEMVITSDKGLFVYAADKKAPEIAESNPRFAETRSQLASFHSRLGASAYITEMVEQELKKSTPQVE